MYRRLSWIIYRMRQHDVLSTILLSSLGYQIIIEEDWHLSTSQHRRCGEGIRSTNQLIQRIPRKCRAWLHTGVIELVCIQRYVMKWASTWSGRNQHACQTTLEDWWERPIHNPGLLDGLGGYHQALSYVIDTIYHYNIKVEFLAPLPAKVDGWYLLPIPKWL